MGSIRATDEIEAAFKCLKSDLGIRRSIINWSTGWTRTSGDLLAYCLTVTLKHRLRLHAPGLTPRSVLEKLAGILLDVLFRLPMVAA